MGGDCEGAVVGRSLAVVGWCVGRWPRDAPGFGQRGPQLALAVRLLPAESAADAHLASGSQPYRTSPKPAVPV